MDGLLQGYVVKIIHMYCSDYLLNTSFSFIFYDLTLQERLILCDILFIHVYVA